MVVAMKAAMKMVMKNLMVMKRQKAVRMMAMRMAMGVQLMLPQPVPHKHRQLAAQTSCQHAR